MADYFPLIARALDNLGDMGPGARAQVYERARSALMKQLTTLDPPLGAADLDRESRALDDAIARAEAVYGEGGEGGEGAARSAHEPPFEHAAPASFDDREPADEGRRAALEIRPAPRRKPLAVALALTVVIVPVAIYAWLQRDQSATPVQTAAPAAPAQPSAQPTADTKFSDRVGRAPLPGNGGDRSAASSPARQDAAQRPSSPAQTQAPSQPAAAPTTESGSAAQPSVLVASRAVLIEEDTEPQQPQQPKISSGRATWRLDSINGGQGQPLEAVVRANVDFPDAGLTMAMAMRKNTDAAFPASHTIEFTFTLTGDPPRIVRDVAPPQLKTDDTSRGVPLSGLSVPVKDNVSLVGLSNLRGDTERNTELLRQRNWIDVPIRFASGKRAVISFEKGVSGDRVVADALRQWGAP